ncbi:MAG: hypothetical protein ACK56I_12010, partial [bacterium]
VVSGWPRLSCSSEASARGRCASSLQQCFFSPRSRQNRRAWRFRSSREFWPSCHSAGHGGAWPRSSLRGC